MERTTKHIEQLSLAELSQLQQELQQGAPVLKKYIEQQITTLQTTNCKSCAHCGTEINASYHHNLTLTFGPADFRKKATLCGMDCMEQFLQKVKHINEQYMLQER